MINFFKFNFLITPYIISFVYFFGAIVIPIILIYLFKTKYTYKLNTKVRLILMVIFLCILKFIYL